MCKKKLVRFIVFMLCVFSIVSYDLRVQAGMIKSPAAPVIKSPEIKVPAVTVPSVTSPKASSQLNVPGAKKQDVSISKNLISFINQINRSKSFVDLKALLEKYDNVDSYSEEELQLLAAAVLQKENDMSRVFLPSSTLMESQIKNIISSRTDIDSFFNGINQPNIPLSVSISVTPSEGYSFTVDKDILSTLKDTGVSRLIVTAGNYKRIVYINSLSISKGKGVKIKFLKINGRYKILTSFIS